MSIPLSLVHLIYTAGDKCMRQNACFLHILLCNLEMVTDKSQTVLNLTSMFNLCIKFEVEL